MLSVKESCLCRRLSKKPVRLTVSTGIHMHRDVKPENVFFTSMKSFLLTDCDSAVVIMEGQSSRQCCGTPGYLAPEVPSQNHYNELVDLFSFGAVMTLW